MGYLFRIILKYKNGFLTKILSGYSIKPAFLYAGLNKKLTSRIQVVNINGFFGVNIV